MPSTSKKQRNFMAAAAHNPAFAKKVGISQDVAKEFNQADKGRKFGSGGMKESKEMMKKEVSFMKKKGAPASMVKHEEAEMKGMKKGGKAYAKGGMTEIAKKEVKAHEKRMHGMAKGGVTRADGCATKGHTKGKMIAMKRGGAC